MMLDRYDYARYDYFRNIFYNLQLESLLIFLHLINFIYYNYSFNKTISNLI